MPIKPTPLTLTLRLKHHKTTILLHVDQLQSLASIKTELLHALRETNPDNTFGGAEIPAEPKDVLLAKPVDQNDLSLGWTSLEPSALTIPDTEDGLANGKSKSAKGKGKASKAGEQTPASVGLRDGIALAFKFRGQDELNEQDEDEALQLDDEETWDVLVPTYDDTYGVGEELEEQARLEREAALDGA
ncbi:hypothetical protein LTR66_010501 [Elasticomyces elasticus]|nr:hypothetical protein LTR28_002103 [Elasticomyces elasticus]KAK4979455.1 hypothetical protein LTR66_010501 [Elasticomyces elasticus]